MTRAQADDASRRRGAPPAHRVEPQSEGRYSLPFLLYFGYSLTKGFWLGRLDTTAFWIADAVSFVVIPATLVSAFRLPLRARDLRDPPDRAITRSWGPIVFNGFLLALGVRIVYVLSALALNEAGVTDALTLPATISYTGMLPRSGPWFWVGTVYLALTAAVVEEYTYRFLLRAALRRHTDSKLAFIVLSAVTFAAVHWGTGLRNVVAAFFVGLMLAAVYVRAGDVRVPMAGHGLFWLRLLLP